MMQIEQPAGLHKNGTGGTAEGLGDYITRLSAAGLRPVVCSPDDAGLAVEVGLAGGLAIFRKTAWSYEPAYDSGDPGADGRQRWHEVVKPALPPEIADNRDVVWLEILTEPRKEAADYVHAFMLAYAKEANRDGYRVAGPSWSTGTPEVDAWESEAGLAWLRYLAGNDRAALALHEYSLDPTDVRTGSPWLVGRFQFILDVCDEVGIAHPCIMITEAGWTYDDMPDPEPAMEQVKWMADVYGDIPFALWTIGQWQDAPGLPLKLQKIIPAMTEWILANYEPVEESNEGNGALDYKSIGVLAPQNATLQQMLEIRRQNYEQRRTITQSHHEALRLRQLGLPGSYTIIYELDEWEPQIRDLLLAGEHEIRHFAEQDPAPEIVDVVDELPVHETKEYNSRQPSAIEWITVHHTATPATTTPQQIASYHVNSRDWPGIAYHFCILPDGTIMQTQRLTTISYHDALNSDSLGLAMIGNFTDAPPPEAQLAAAAALVAWLQTSLDGVQVRAHRDVGQTSCPGATWRQWWPRLSGEPAPLPEHLALEPLSQRDPRWAGATLGQNTGHGETIGSFGCLYAAYYMMARFLGIESRGFLQTHEHFKQAGAFSGPFLRSGALAMAYPQQVANNGWRVRTDPQMEPAIRAYLDDGIPVAARVDFVPATSTREQHWVVLIGYDGDDYVIADPWTGQIGMLSQVYGVPGVDVLEAVYYRPKAPATMDLLPYLRGDGRLYEVRNADGGQERFQTQVDGDIFYQTKNKQWEMLRFDEQFIWRDIDTSPGGDRFYRLLEQGSPGSRWIPRHWAPGGEYSRARRVQFYRKSDCQPLTENSGDVVDTMRFVARHETYTFRTGIELPDVIELLWVNGGEKYFYARNFGLVAWERLHQDPQTPQWSAISELHGPGERPDNVREEIGCL